MNADKLRWMLRNNGVYILTDVRMPGATFPIVVQGADEVKGRPGVMHTLKPHQLISQDPTLWAETTELAGGPFSSQEYESEEFWRSMALKCRPLLRYARDRLLSEGSDSLPKELSLAGYAQEILDRLEMAEAAEMRKAAVHLHQPCPANG